MIGIDKPLINFRRAQGAAAVGVAWAAGSIFAFNGSPVLQLLTAASAGIAAYWLTDKVRQEREWEKQLSLLRFFNKRELPRQDGRFYLGRGYLWQRRHALCLRNLFAEDQDVHQADPQARGDLRIFGVGGLEAEDFWYPEKDNNQHVGIFGGPGFGKTRLAELFVDQAIGIGAGTIIIDPKGDPALRARAERAAKREGKTFRLFDLTNPLTSASYNPLIRYSDPAQLGARFASICPPATGDNKFFVERAAATGQTVALAMDALKKYILALGGNDKVPPAILVSLQARAEILAEKPDVEPSEDDIKNKIPSIKLPAWFIASRWTPRLTAGDIYGVERPHVLLAWMVRIAHFHLIEGPLESAEGATREDAPGRWKFHNDEVPQHPLGDLSADAVKARYLKLVPDLAQAKAAWLELRNAMGSVNDICNQGMEYWQKVNSSLPAALARFRGPRERIVCAENPDIKWPELFEEKEVAYFALGAMVDRTAAEGFARAIIEDLTAYIGERNANGLLPCPVYLITDEIASFITPAYVDLLNKSRSAGLRCVAIGQTISDLEVTLGTAARAEQMLGNLNTIIQLRSPSRKDAEAFAKRSGQVGLLDIVRNFNSTSAVGETGSKNVQGFTATEGAQFSIKEKDKVPPEAITNLPVAQAFIAGMGFLGIFSFPLIED